VGTAFYVGVSFASMGTVFACMMEWKNLKAVAEEQRKDIESVPSSEPKQEDGKVQHLPELNRASETAEKDEAV